jgi:hypothetical protein
MLNLGPLWVWLLTGALVRTNVVPGVISARTSCRKDGSIEMRSARCSEAVTSTKLRVCLSRACRPGLKWPTEIINQDIDADQEHPQRED